MTVETRRVNAVCFGSLRADFVFGFRQLRKRKVAAGAAILSLALTIGACASAFRLVDALLLRPLPVSAPERLYAIARAGFPKRGAANTYDGWEYRRFRELRGAVKGQAELIAAGFANRADLTYRSDQEMEKAHLQYVSGWMFQSFGLSPTAGRLLTEDDDREPGSHPVAVLSYDYWSRRFGQDPKAVGRSFHLGSNQGQASPGTVYQIVGVAPEGFTGTEPGTVTDIFLPTAMNGYVNLPIAAFLRIFVRLNPGVSPEAVRDRLQAAYRGLEEQDRRSSTDRWTAAYRSVIMRPAASGASGLQKDYLLPLETLGAIVALILLIACANVANLMTAQSAARAREMALRTAIGAGRWRLVRLVLIESSMLATAASAAGALFTLWAAPFVVGRINPPDNPVRLFLPADLRVFVFGVVLTFGVMLLFGLGPAVRASAVKPAMALRGGENPSSRRRLMQVLVAVQFVFCVVVLFLGGLFVTTSERLSKRSTGFSSERLLTVDAIAKDAPSAAWEEMKEHLRTVPGVERVALSEWALLDGWGFKYSEVSVDGTVDPSRGGIGFLSVSPGWLETMRIPLLDGRDFRLGDVYLNTHKSGVAIVNREFANQYFHGQDPVGKSFEATTGGLRGARFDIVGLAGDAAYRDLREPDAPVVYNAFPWVEGGTWGRLVGRATFIIKTSSSNPATFALALRREISRANPDFYVSNIRTQQELVEMHTVRERLLAMLAWFFSSVALLLAGVGLYGVLDYSVLERRREIGIRMALGARPFDTGRQVTLDIFALLAMGAAAGLVIGMISVRYVRSLLYGVAATDPGVLAVPFLAIMAAATLAAIPPLIRAVRIDPARVLRAE